MPTVDINYAAVVTTALVNVCLGLLWYSRLFFGSEWSRLVGPKMEELRSNAFARYIVFLLAAFLQTYILAHFVRYSAADSLIDGAITGFWLWLGFVALATAVNTAFSGRAWALWKIDVSYFLVTLLLSGAILAVWQ